MMTAANPSYPYMDLYGNGHVVLFQSVVPYGGRLAGFGAAAFDKAHFVLACKEDKMTWPKRYRIMKSKWLDFYENEPYTDFLVVCPSSSFEVKMSDDGKFRSAWLTIANENDLTYFKMTLSDILT